MKTSVLGTIPILTRSLGYLTFVGHCEYLACALFRDQSFQPTSESVTMKHEETNCHDPMHKTSVCLFLLTFQHDQQPVHKTYVSQCCEVSTPVKSKKNHFVQIHGLTGELPVGTNGHDTMIVILEIT